MNSRMPSPLSVPLCGILFGILGLGACSGGGTVETNVRLPAAERPDVTPVATSKAIQVPDGVAFNYPRFSSGQEGPDAVGRAVRAGENGATVSAKVNGEGKAWGAFQLGYAFDHQAGNVSHCVVRVRLTAKETASAKRDAEAAAGKSSDGTVNLVFFMKDSMGLTVKEEALVSSSLNRGPQGATTQHDFVFDAELQPERGYYVVISGRVDASSGADAAASVELDVSDVAMEIRWDGKAAASATLSSQGGA